MISEGPSFFVLFVCKDGSLNLRPQVLALPASVTKARPAKTTQKLNIYRLDLPDRIFASLKSNNVFALLFFIFVL